MAALRGFELTALDKFVAHGLAEMDEVTGMEALIRKTQAEPSPYGHSLWTRILNGDGFMRNYSHRDWAVRMLALLGAEELRAGALLFHLHERTIQKTGYDSRAGILTIAMRDTVDWLVFRSEADTPLPFTARERMLVFWSSMALLLSARGPPGWAPSLTFERSGPAKEYFWKALDHPDGAPLLRALIRQIVDRRIWLHPSGLFAPQAASPAAASPLHVEGLALQGVHRLRGLLVEALRRGWITVEEAEGVVALNPLLEPWWLLSRTTAQTHAEPAELQTFAIRLRGRFVARLETLPDLAEPHLEINIRFDIGAEDEWGGSEEGGSAAPYGSAGLLAAARWAERNLARMGARDADPGALLVRRLAMIRGLDTGEEAAAVIAALKGLSKAALGVVFPWAGNAQALVLQALGLGLVEPLRAWLVRYAGQDPGYPWILGDVLGNSADAGEGAVDVVGLKAALNGVSTKEWKALLAMYTKAGMLSGAEKVLAAATGEADREKLREAASVKENQPAIKLLGLLPVADAAELRDRYLLLQRIAKQASRHGAQRQGTQRAAAQAGLGHLAQTAGFSDAAELEWVMESSRGAALQPSFAPRAISEYEAWIEIANLKPALRVRNAAGKVLASTPAPLKKHADMKALDATFGEVKEQLRRFTRLMEVRMTLEVPVSRAQLQAGLAHPVMAPIVGSLVWIDEAGQTGFFGEQGLTGPDGTRPVVGEQLRVAHSVHLLKGEGGAAMLSRWQRWLVEGGRVQAFKQVFREIYVPTPAELEAGEESARYSGRTIRTSVAQGILQSRNWVPPREWDGGATRLLFADGLAAKCRFAVGHYFTEAEETETMEMWFERGANRIALHEVPAVAFSEAMRDIDLLVSRSVAEGNEGVEARTSTATMAARADLLRALAPALGEGVLELQESHALVRGQLASYRIHLASGNIHVEPGAYLCIIPDPAAAARGDAVLLPFAEEDQKTAEIVSKVLLLAHDSRIRDESILRQIQRERT
ncbi:MAG: DUF7737 domain-containing protein [Usitatibacter sp.]